MCTTDVYTYVYPDGHREPVSRPSLCPSSRNGLPCSKNVVFQHSSKSVPFGYPVSSSAFTGPATYPPANYGAFPPTPTYTPRTSTPLYRSGDESDRSYHSSSSNRRNRVYINGSRMDSGRYGQGGRTVLVHNPPTASTPPQAFTMPRTAPSSPSFANTAPFVVDASPRGSSSRRPVIVDDRVRSDREGARIHIEFMDSGRKKKHHRHTSSSSYASTSEDDERRRHRREVEQLRAENRRLEQEQEIREQRLRARIAKANAEIAGRDAVPVRPGGLRRTSTAAKATHNVGDREGELLDAIHRLDIQDRGRHSKREADEAQRERLMQRMLPRRRATVGPGSRRHRVEYTDGVYRWE